MIAAGYVTFDDSVRLSRLQRSRLHENIPLDIAKRSICDRHSISPVVSLPRGPEVQANSGFTRLLMASRSRIR